MIRFNFVGFRGFGVSRSLPRLGTGFESSGLAALIVGDTDCLFDLE